MTFEELNKKLGGIECRENWTQTQHGGWVHKNATVDKTATVADDALVYGSARVYDSARVYGSAWETTPLHVLGTQHSVTNSIHGHITIGCKCETFAWWLEHGEAFALKNGYTKDEIAELRRLVLRGLITMPVPPQKREPSRAALNMRKYRAANPEKYREMNRRHTKAFRARRKAQ
jgi:hypothetical protein